jgi:hypothetical protein
VVEVEGLAVTDPVRTALDLARSLPHEAAVVVLDAALHRGLLAQDSLRKRLSTSPARPAAGARPGPSSSPTAAARASVSPAAG